MKKNTQRGIVCPTCENWNPPGNSVCGNCGRQLILKKAFFVRLINFFFGGGEFTAVKGLLIVLFFLLVIVGIILSFAGLIFIPWLGSAFITTVLLYIIKPWKGHKGERLQGGYVLIGGVFLSLMGMAIDQGGNPLENKVIEKTCCKGNESLSQELNSYQVRPGETIYTRTLYCIEENGKIRPIPVPTVLLFKFSWYLILFYFLYGVKFFIPRKTD